MVMIDYFMWLFILFFAAMGLCFVLILIAYILSYLAGKIDDFYWKLYWKKRRGKK